jgi:hypothetical protein
VVKKGGTMVGWSDERGALGLIVGEREWDNSRPMCRIKGALEYRRFKVEMAGCGERRGDRA